MVVHTEVFWKLKTHIKMRHSGRFKLTFPKSVLKLYSRYILFHPWCKSLVAAWDSYSRLLQSPFYFLFLRGQNFTHSNSGLNPRCGKQVLILHDLTTECASRCGENMPETCGPHSCLLRFSCLRATPFLRMVSSKCGCQARVLASLTNLLKGKLLAPIQSY